MVDLPNSPNFPAPKLSHYTVHVELKMAPFDVIWLFQFGWMFYLSICDCLPAAILHPHRGACEKHKSYGSENLSIMVGNSVCYPYNSWSIDGL